MRIVLSYSNLPKEPVKVPISCACFLIIGAWNSFNFIETYMMHKYHIALTNCLVAGNRFDPPDDRCTFLYDQ